MHFAIEAVYQVTGHLPLPYINTSHLGKIATRGGVGGQLPRNLNWSHFYFEEEVVIFNFGGGGEIAKLDGRMVSNLQSLFK